MEYFVTSGTLRDYGPFDSFDEALNYAVEEYNLDVDEECELEEFGSVEIGHRLIEIYSDGDYW